jgi:hypothetical protein
LRKDPPEEEKLMKVFKRKVDVTIHLDPKTDEVLRVKLDDLKIPIKDGYLLFSFPESLPRLSDDRTRH